MSTNPPPYPPPPPQGYPPQGFGPQGYPPYPVKNKTSPVVWVLLGLGIFFVVCVLAVVGAGFFVMHKAKQAGLDTDLIKRNPALATVKMMAALNPDVEIVALDDDRGQVTVRDKKSGKTFKVDLENAKRGKFVMQEEGKDPVSITTNGDGGNGTVEMQSADGSFKVGGGPAKVPSWVPDYPSSKPQAAFAAQNKDGSSGSFTFKTNDSLDSVLKFYETGLKAEGMKVTNTVSQRDGQGAGGMIQAERDRKSVMVVFGSDDGSTTVSVTFSDKK